MTAVDGSCTSIRVQFGVQWLADNWFLVLTALVAIYGVFVGTKSLGVAKKSLGLARSLAKREITEDVSIERVFPTSRGDELRVEIVNRGTIPVFIKSVGVYMPAVEKGFILHWTKGDRGEPLAAGNRGFYGRRFDEILGFTKGKGGAQVAVLSNKQELAKTEGDEVASLIAKAQATLSK